ncbi:GNAT family N-acetyltransferase [Egicoccus sp. AB-alg6-2]|uniref:GNAT family N-acetyltransferase n=1 Tax=Egicoccus sp. AB-alg6-2 TaxID=3242692 RepID=UPI00359F10D6
MTGGGLRRVDERLGLAVCRVSLSGRSLVTYARDHVTVRTPSRPDFRDGNTLDLIDPPDAADVARWIARFHDTIGVLGVPHVQLRWELPLAPDAPPEPPVADAALGDAARAQGLELAPLTVLLLDAPVVPPPAPVAIAPVPPPSAVDPQPTDRRWHAATVLYRYDAPDRDDPEVWRTWNEEFVAWSVDVQRELAAAERAQVWVAQRHGAPVARATLVHDRQGLAAVEDVIVHPVHRRLGIAAALTHTAVAAHLHVAPSTRVGIAAEPGGPADRLYRRLGFAPHATVWTARRV